MSKLAAIVGRCALRSTTGAVLIGDDEAALKILNELRAIGVRGALDDFGTGYSSLGYLRRFPFHRIKIDRSFINGLTDKGASSGIVRAVVAMASEYNMATTAEGVETEEQREMLRQLDCSEMQGFLFSRPITGPQLRHLLQGVPEQLARSASNTNRTPNGIGASHSVGTEMKEAAN